MRPAPRPPAPVPRRLLVVVDPAARSQPALAKAARLARAARAQVEVYACEYREGFDRPGRTVAAARREACRAGAVALGRLARVPLRGVPVRVAYELDHPRAERILARVRRVRPDLVVLDSRVHVGPRRALFGPADWPLIRACPVPLLYAGSSRWHAAPRIAAAVDPRHAADPRGRLDARLVAAARGLARALRGSLTVVHAWLPLEPTAAGPLALGLPGAPPAEVERELAAAESAATRAVAALCRGGLPRATPVLLRGAAVDALPGFAAARALDVLALGAIARRRLAEWLIGATAERLLERVPCDLLIVKAKRRSRRRAV